MKRFRSFSPACGNGTLTGTNTGNPIIDEATSRAAATYTPKWCTKYDEIASGKYTKQHFGRMWYDLLIDSHVLLNIKKGVDDPYTWTIGTGKFFVEWAKEMKRKVSLHETLHVIQVVAIPSPANEIPTRTNPTRPSCSKLRGSYTILTRE